MVREYTCFLCTNGDPPKVKRASNSSHFSIVIEDTNLLPSFFDLYLHNNT